MCAFIKLYDINQYNTTQYNKRLPAPIVIHKSIENRSTVYYKMSLNDLTAKSNVNYKCGPMPNVMAALPNIGGALCSTPQSLADAQYWSAVQ